MKLRTKFQDEDFELGEVVEANIYYGGGGRIKVIAEPTRGGITTFYFETLKGMNEMFEDYEEPKGSALDLMILTLTNFIENEPDVDKVDLDDCKQMLDKLKAWKRLKDKEFEFVGCFKDNTINFEFVGHPLSYDEAEEAEQDLALLFSQEDE